MWEAFDLLCVGLCISVNLTVTLIHLLHLHYQFATEVLSSTLPMAPESPGLSLELLPLSFPLLQCVLQEEERFSCHGSSH